ncbi:hypothetical protein C8F04DRAFT_1228393 [Mycena alexandri]|uniref:Uncharacterized protein n=1 Tax=Mycena alexandri TaxID=1745969 RepID=A0AAD6TDP1_9AGAR|nr:hypothetical protein C8F04DRAFT_1228393 [Mycena alexandri]
MGGDSQPEPSTSSTSTRAVLDFLRVGVALDAAQAPRLVKKVDPPAVEALAAQGVKVRDFAYESKLPPIKPYVRRPIQPSPRVFENAVAGPSSAPYGSQSQSQPHNPRALKRTRRDGTEETDLGYGFVMGVARVAPEEGGGRPRKLQRTTTDLSLPESQSQSRSQPPPRRENAVLNIDEEAALRAAAYDIFGGSQPDSQSQGYWQQSQGYSEQESQEYYSQSQSNSQDTEFVPTPFVTPNGSLQWIDGEGPPNLRNKSPPLVPTEPVSLQCSTSTVRTAPPGSPTPAPLRRASPFPPQSASPTTAPTATAAAPATAPLARPHHDLLTRTLSSLSTLSSPLSEAPPSSAPIPGPSTSAVLPRTPSPPPRYHLRKRAAPASPVRSPKRRGRPAPRREESLAVVIQS